MRMLFLGLVGLMLLSMNIVAAQSCPEGYQPCGRGICCPG